MKKKVLLCFGTRPEAIKMCSLVHGDTTTSTVCALAAFNRGIKVGHVEAGLRTFDKYSPFPEELNRQLTGRIADFHFAPTTASQSNLLSEGIKDKNTMVKNLEKHHSIAEPLKEACIRFIKK